MLILVLNLNLTQIRQTIIEGNKQSKKVIKVNSLIIISLSYICLTIIANYINMSKQLHNNEVFYIEDQKLKKQDISDLNNNTQKLKANTKYSELTLKIDDITYESFLKIETQYYILQIYNQKTDQDWKITRRYSDFQWLYQSVSASYPGTILPYFPCKTIQSYLIQKLNIQMSKSKEQQLSLRKKQLQNFIVKLSQHQQVKYSQQFAIFVQPNQQQFKKMKKVNMNQLEEANSYQSKSFFSIFQKGIAWATEGKKQMKAIQQIPEWRQTQVQIKRWILQITTILQKVQRMVELKKEETQWEGPQTQIDSVQILKAKVISGRQYNELFIQEINSKVLPILQSQTKNMKQLQAQLIQRQQSIKILLYLRKSGGSESRIQKLLRKKQMFEQTLTIQWKQQKMRLKKQISAIKKQFGCEWKEYCQKMTHIWK